jgi:CheY-like chemotaxis protein
MKIMFLPNGGINPCYSYSNNYYRNVRFLISWKERNMSQVLSIDDDQDLQKLIELHLSRAGFRVILPDNGEAGLKLAESGVPDLILLDIFMPGMDGFETIKKILVASWLRHQPGTTLTLFEG